VLPPYEKLYVTEMGLAAHLDLHAATSVIAPPEQAWQPKIGSELETIQCPEQSACAAIDVPGGGDVLIGVAVSEQSLPARLRGVLLECSAILK
jgi:hypothetical protein